MVTFLAALVLAAGPAPATPAEPAQAAQPSPDRIVCRSRPKLGSRIARERICKTEAEWEAYDQDLAQARRDAQSTGLDRPARNEGLFPCTPTQPC